MPPHSGGTAQRTLPGQTDFTRASRLTSLGGDSGSPLLDQSPLTVDSRSPLPGQHWCIYGLSAIGSFATRIAAAGPLAGLFLVPFATPIESLQDGVSAQGWNINARGIQLPTILQTQVIGAAPFAFTCIYNGQIPFYVPNGWKIRGLFNCAPATANPGPGIGSFARLDILGCVENDAEGVS